MSKKEKIQIENNILWKDRKRILGMPISFTKYTIDDDRLYMQQGFFKTEINEILLYRILDVKSSRTLGQKIFGVGTVTLYCADQSNRTLELKNVKNPLQVHKFVSEIVERERRQKGVAGAEMVGAAGMNLMGMDGECDCGHDGDISFEDFGNNN